MQHIVRGVRTQTLQLWLLCVREPSLRSLDYRRRAPSRRCARWCARPRVGDLRVECLAPQVEIRARVHAQVLPRRVGVHVGVRCVVFPMLCDIGAFHSELERVLVHPHSSHLLVRHRHSVHHERGPRRPFCIRLCIRCVDAVHRRSEQLHVHGPPPGEARAPSGRAVKQHTRVSRPCQRRRAATLVLVDLLDRDLLIHHDRLQAVCQFGRLPEGRLEVGSRARPPRSKYEGQ